MRIRPRSPAQDKNRTCENKAHTPTVCRTQCRDEDSRGAYSELIRYPRAGFRVRWPWVESDPFRMTELPSWLKPVPSMKGGGSTSTV